MCFHYIFLLLLLLLFLFIQDDIWAESRWIGFLWYYYACIHGQVYDITEWAGCKVCVSYI
jgi:hypothetical protein